MRKFIPVTLLALAATIFAGAGLGAPPETILIDDCVNKQSAVEFPHAAHFEKLDCVSCHHKQPELSLETADTAKPCSECHITPEDANAPACGQMSMKKNPFHITCISCHKEQGNGPKVCKDCHPKQ